MMIEQKISVPFAFPVVFTDHIFAQDNPVLVEVMNRLREGRQHRAMAFVDENVRRAAPKILTQIEEYFHAQAETMKLAAPVQVAVGGESAKNDLNRNFDWAAQMLDCHLDRHAFVLIIGGGAVLDAVGFAASLVHRGLRIIRIPTTVLAQNDGGVGVKTGINFRGVKNALGTFTPPFAVINDFQFLLTLNDREWRSGVAEAFKVAIIRDRDFFDWLNEHAKKLHARDEASMRHLVRHCAELHLEHIRAGGDPFEMGHARPLDFGHWSAHKLEALSDFSISHGDAVAAGILLDSAYAMERGWMNEIDFRELHASLGAVGFPAWHKELEGEDIFDGLREFQEHLGGELCVTFPKEIGARHEVHDIDFDVMRRALAKIKALAS